MAHTNGYIPNHTDHLANLHITKLEAEASFYKKLAESYANELRNVPDAIEKYGYWTCDDGKGEIIKLVKQSED